MAKNANQLLLDLPLRPALGREDFFVTTANHQAVNAIDKWPDWPNPVLVLSGPSGSGKSHLGQVWRMATGAAKASPQQLNIDDLPTLMEKGALLVEDLPGPNLDETALFHLINLVREHKGFLLLTSKQPAASWKISLPDLSSRLAVAGSARLNEPDDDLLRAIIIKQFSDRQLSVTEDTVSFMLARMERSAQAACALVDKIDTLAMQQKANITKRFVSGILNA